MSIYAAAYEFVLYDIAYKVELYGAAYRSTSRPFRQGSDQYDHNHDRGAGDGFAGQPTTRAALQLMAILFPRPGELRAARWSEFDFDAAIWTIPAERTKMRRAHRIPLPEQAVAILRALYKITGEGALVFPPIRSMQSPMSDNTLNAALRRLG